MKILFITPYIPSKIRTRSFNFIKNLKKLGHSITCIGLDDPYCGEDSLIELKKYCDLIEIFKKSKLRSYFDCLISLFTRLPLQAAYSYSYKMKSRISFIIAAQQFDIIHVEHIRAGYLVPSDRNLPAIYDSVDCITSLYKHFTEKKASYAGKLISFIESLKLEKAEPHLISLYDKTIVTAFRDKHHLENLFARTNSDVSEIDVVENGADFDYFKPSGIPFEKFSIVFTGKMGYYANELAANHFIREIFPKIKSKIKNAKIYIVGANPSKSLRQLENQKDIIITGWVEDIRDFLGFAHVVVCPVRVAAGVQNKVLEAMSMGKAIVAYPEVIVPLDIEDENDRILIANDSAQFAECVIRLMNEDSLRIKLQANSRQFVLKHYDWHEKARKLETIYSNTIREYGHEQNKTGSS